MESIILTYVLPKTTCENNSHRTCRKVGFTHKGKIIIYVKLERVNIYDAQLIISQQFYLYKVYKFQQKTTD